MTERKMVEFTWVTGETGEDGEEATLPLMIDASTIVRAHPRKFGAPGTRLVTSKGTGLPVLETFSQVLEALDWPPSRFPQPTAEVVSIVQN